ncbi:MAG: DUF4352 domain-containing protein [Firmicutes bacterium]|nr:DUF4352 domain-containing protein [Bacillota bacterium]
MRKLISFFMIMAMVFTITGCSDSAKPEATVSEFIEAAKVFDFDKMATTINPSNLNNEKITDLMESDDDQYQKYFLDYLKANANKITYTIADVKIDDNTAIVSVDTRYVNGGPLLKATIAEVFTKAIALAFTGVEMTEEETSQMFISAMQTQEEVVAESFVEKTIDVKCTKIDNQWYIDEPSDELLDVIMSNFISVGKELDDNFDSSSTGDDNTLMEQALQDNMTIIEKATGDEIILATVLLKVTGVEEKQSISTSYGSPTEAKEDAKFVVVSLDLTNTTNKTFSFPPDLIVVDNKGREFNTFSDSIFAIDDYLDYRDLSPSIKETGYLVYELPTDAVSYNLVVAKSGTNELYKILLK